MPSPRHRSRCFFLLLSLAACNLEEPKADAGDDSGPSLPDAALEMDAASDAQVDAQADASPPISICPAEKVVADGCESLGGHTEGSAGRCDGYDNDCDGLIDDGCDCANGSVQTCFAGPPGRADTGACQRGMQVCNAGAEFGGWGPCERGISPQEEVCDRLDNDCNGCTDERSDCAVFIDCPGENDPRIPRVKPFAETTLDGTRFYNGNDVAKWEWSIEGSPCDQLFSSIPGSPATATNGQLSYKLTPGGEDGQTAKVRFSLSGTYLVTLTIVRTSGEKLSCTFPLVVGAGGLRVELCWDKTGPTAGSQAVDLDLHLALKGRTSAFFANGSGTDKDFYAYTFANQNFSLPNGIWGHAPSPDVNGCLTGGQKGSADQIHMLRKNCINPRLDLDNQGNTDPSRYLPENINLDNPRKGELFQVAVNHVSTQAIRVRALVNVYCAGKLRGSFELDPKSTAFSDLSSEDSELWRVVEIAPDVNAQGVTQDCKVTPLHPPAAPQDRLVTVDNFAITWSN